MKRVIIVLFFLVYLGLVSFASHIALSTTVAEKVVGDHLRISVSAVNKGDESAYNVRAEIRIGQQKLLAQKVPVLAVNETYQVQQEVKLNYRLPGEYPLIVTLRYADANLYPFSAVSCQTFLYKTKASPSEISGTISSVTLDKKGKMKLTLNNKSGSRTDVSNFWVIPNELATKINYRKIKIPPRSARGVILELDNLSALDGSAYEIYAVSEYEKDNLHKTNITPGMVKIAGSKNIFGVNRLFLMAAAIILALFFVVAQFSKRP